MQHYASPPLSKIVAVLLPIYLEVGSKSASPSPNVDRKRFDHNSELELHKKAAGENVVSVVYHPDSFAFDLSFYLTCLVVNL